MDPITFTIVFAGKTIATTALATAGVAAASAKTSFTLASIGKYFTATGAFGLSGLATGGLVVGGVVLGYLGNSLINSKKDFDCRVNIPGVIDTNVSLKYNPSNSISKEALRDASFRCCELSKIHKKNPRKFTEAFMTCMGNRFPELDAEGELKIFPTQKLIL